MNFDKLFLTALFPFLITSVQGQTIKSIYKNLKKEQYSNALSELKEVQKEKGLSNDDEYLLSHAAIIILIKTADENDDFINAKRYFDRLTYSSKKTESYLKKFGYCHSCLEVDIYQTFYERALKTNTEAAYYSALSICENCFYQQEFNSKKETAAYNETLEEVAIDKCDYFLKNYATSKHYKEIKELRLKLGFEAATNKNTVKSYAGFLAQFPTENKYKEETETRIDQLKFNQTPETYPDYKKFLRRYPNTQFKDKITTRLPDLMFQKAFEEKDISLMKDYIINYPDHYRVSLAEKELEKLYIEKLTVEMSPNLLQEFKELYPDNNQISTIEATYKQQLKNSTWYKMELQSSVKVMKETKYAWKEKFGEYSFIEGSWIQYEFNPLGLVERETRSTKAEFTFSYGSPCRYGVPLKERQFDPVQRWNGTYNYQCNGNEVTKTYNQISGYYPNYDKEVFQFNSSGKVTEKKEYKDRNVSRIFTYKYDQNNNRTEFTYFDNEGRKIKSSVYEFDKNNNLLSESDYKKKYDRDELQYMHTYTYNSKGDCIKKRTSSYSYSYSYSAQIFEYTYDSRGFITQKKTFFKPQDRESYLNVVEIFVNDQHGNWTTKTTTEYHDTGELYQKHKITREFKYY